jgi:hypothetical protein
MKTVDVEVLSIGEASPEPWGRIFLVASSPSAPYHRSSCSRAEPRVKPPKTVTRGTPYPFASESLRSRFLREARGRLPRELRNKIYRYILEPFEGTWRVDLPRRIQRSPVFGPRAWM